MFAVVQSDNGLPTVVSQNSNDYPSFIMAGYTVLFEGCKKDCDVIYDDLIVEFAAELD